MLWEGNATEVVMRTEKVLHEATIVFLVQGKKVLLAWKTEKIGKHKWNGYGGGVKHRETPREAAARELFEETGHGVRVHEDDLEQGAIVHFHNRKSDGTEFMCTVHVFMTSVWTGEVLETREMVKPTWFRFADLPLDNMMPADGDWLPRVLAGEKIIAHAHLGPYQETKLAPTDVQVVAEFTDR